MKNVIYKILPLVCLFHQATNQLIRDTRCFLENGATAAHLFVSEDMEIGDTIGVLGVLGDPSLLGDIELRLQEHDSPVSFAPYSRNLTLTRPLDKEGIEGPASVYVNVICERKHTHDPGFVIPVNIRVIDANDNAPEFINAPYVLNISEVTVVGTRVLQGVKAVDADQPGPYSTVQYSILPGPHSDYFIFVNALEGTLVLRKPLDYETLSNFSVKIHAQDQGNPPQSSSTTLYVNVLDADDQNPAFLNDQYKVYIPSQIKTRKVLKTEPAPIKAVDQDVGINVPVRYSIQSGNLPFLTINPETADLIVTRSLQDHELITSAIIVIKATQIDNADRYALATVIVEKERTAGNYSTNGSVNDRLPIRFVLKEYQSTIPENTPLGTLILTTGVNKIDSNLKFWLEGASEDTNKFLITNLGDLILKDNLDYEKKIQHTFFVHVADEHNNDTAKVNVSVEDVNEWEPRFRHPRYEFHTRTFNKGALVGRLEAADGDRGDRIVLSLRGPDAKFFEIRDNGELILRSSEFNSSIARLVAVATDTGNPSRSSMIPVIVHLPNLRISPIAAKATPAWLGSSVLSVAFLGAILGLSGVIILFLILYIYKHINLKNGISVSSVESEYREKSPVPSAVNPTPQLQESSILQDTRKVSKNRCCPSNDMENPVFGEDDTDYDTTVKSSLTVRQMPVYLGRKISAPREPLSLSATSNIPNIDGLVQNMNDLSARSIVTKTEAGSQNSLNFSADSPDSLAPTWPVGSICRRVKKLAWDDDEMVDDLEISANTEGNRRREIDEQLKLTVYI